MKYFFLFILLFGADFFTKTWINEALPLINGAPSFYPYGGVAVFDDFFGVQFSLVHATNRGAAWGLLANYPILLIVGRVALLIGLSLYLVRLSSQKKAIFPLGLILMGALANVVDFFRFGHVVDLFYFVFWGYEYPVFNIADIMICVGVVLLAFQLHFEKKRGVA